MPRGYRSIVLAAFGWLIVSAASEPRAIAEPQKASAQESIANSLADIAAIEAEQAKRAERPPERQPCGPGQYESQDDLCAQWKAADAATLAAWLNLAGLAAVLAALYAAFQSNMIARDTAKRQLRAYVSYAALQVHEVDKGELVLIAEWRNSGSTPARASWGQTKFKLIDPNDAGFADFTPDISPDNPAVQIGPGIAMYIECETTLPADILSNVHAGKQGVLAWGFTEYADIFDKVHRTEFATVMKVREEARGFITSFEPINVHNGADGDCMSQPNSDYWADRLKKRKN